jgi:hypothetical protein
MFSNIKSQIKELAKNAVLVAETTLGSGNGKEKKQMAIEYILKNLNCSTLLKNIISILLSSFIDGVVEISVQYINSLPKEEGE